MDPPPWEREASLRHNWNFPAERGGSWFTADPSACVSLRGGGGQPDSHRHHVALLVTRLPLFPSSLHPYSEWRPENGSMRGELKLQSADYNSAASSLRSSRGPRSGWTLEINMRGVSLRCSLARPTPGHPGQLPGPQTTACNWGLTWINKW